MRASPLAICVIAVTALAGSFPARGEAIERIWLSHSRTAETVVVSWQTKEPNESVVEFGPAPNQLDGRASQLARTTLHHLEVPLLSRGELHYRVRSGEHISAVHRVRDAPGAEFRVVVVGNAGYAQRPWGEAVLGARPHLLVFSGDLVPALHLNGRATTPDDTSAFGRLIESAPELFRSTPILAVLGNHDREFRSARRDCFRRRDSAVERK